MAEGAVTFLLDKLFPLLKTGSKHLRDVRGDVDYIASELECITACLRTADAKEDDDPELKVWVKQVREVADDMEDIIDEYGLCVPSNQEHGFLHKIARFPKDFKVQNHLTSKIKNIKSRVQHISEVHHRYCSKFNANNCLEQGPSCCTRSKSWHHCRGDALLVQEAELVGIEEPRKELIWMLLEGRARLKVVPVVGMGGAGKTTLVKKVYDDVQVKTYFEHHAWITVSQSFNIEELLKDMIRQLFGETKETIPEELDSMTSEKLKVLINAFLQHKRYIIVFDDVWSIFAWDDVKHALPNGESGSRIMLTTRHNQIADNSCLESDDTVFHLKPLPAEESWNLFRSKAFRGSTCPPHLRELAQRILGRCEGLPLAIIALGGLMATKNKNRIDEWEIVDRSIGSELESNDKLERLNKILSLSYNDLPYYLKYCFLYFSLFPEDYQIECMRLIRLWMAEGFVVAKEGKTLEEVAESYLTDMINRSLIQIAERAVDGGVKTCRIHDLMHQIILAKSRDQNFATIIGQNNTIRSEKARRLSVHVTLKNLPQVSFAKVRSLLMFEIRSSLNSHVPPSLRSSFLLLRVLDLRGQPLDKFPDDILGLFHLRYLSLRKTRVKNLPRSIGKLRYLETLDLKQTYISNVPTEILHLQQLRHLLVYRYTIESYIPFHSKKGFKALAGLGCLQFLQKLCFVEADQFKVMIEELGKLSQLRKLGILKLKREDGPSLCSSIEKMINLRTLDVTSMEEDEIIDLNSLSIPPPLLKGLYLKGCLEELPKWVPNLTNLSKISLRWSRLRDDPLAALQALPNLVDLQLLQAFEGDMLCFKSGGFQNLKSLKLDRLGLKSLKIEWGTMPCLKEMSILRCRALQRMPFGVQYLSRLESLHFYDMPDEFTRTLLPSEQGDDHWKIENIPDIHFIYYDKIPKGISLFLLPSHD